MLLCNGYEVVEVLVRKSSTRRLPGFFNWSIQAQVKHFISPIFLPTVDNKRVDLKKNFMFFWDKAETEEITRVDETLSFDQIDDVKFLNGMAGCRAFASTAGYYA